METLGFPAGTTFPAPANFGVSRLDILNNELSSGYYSQTSDIAALTREIGRVKSGASGDMADSSSSSWVPGWVKSTNEALAGKMHELATDNPTSMENVIKSGGVSGSVSSSIASAIKQFFADSGTAIATILVGVILLIGAFLTYRK